MPCLRLYLEVTHDGINPTLAFDGTAKTDVSNRFLWGPAVDQLFADEQVTTTSSVGNVIWPLADQVGTLRDLVDFNESTSIFTITNHRTFDSFGNLTAETQSTVDEIFAYTGKFFDDVTKLSNHLNRWLDPNLGKWISEDPIGFQGGDGNISRYVGNSASIAVDSNGLEGEAGVGVSASGSNAGATGVSPSMSLPSFVHMLAMAMGPGNNPNGSQHNQDGQRNRPTISVDFDVGGDLESKIYEWPTFIEDLKQVVSESRLGKMPGLYDPVPRGRLRIDFDCEDFGLAIENFIENGILKKLYPTIDMDLVLVYWPKDPPVPGKPGKRDGHAMNIVSIDSDHYIIDAQSETVTGPIHTDGELELACKEILVTNYELPRSTKITVIVSDRPGSKEAPPFSESSEQINRLRTHLKLNFGTDDTKPYLPKRPK